MKLNRVHHVQVMIPKGREAEAREFYCGVLGLIEIPKPAELAMHGGFWLELEGFQVHFGLNSTEKPKNSREHIAFHVDSIDEWTSKFEKHDIQVIKGATIPGFRRMEFRDPFDNRIEFLESL